jgi:hypothetical protein
MPDNAGCVNELLNNFVSSTGFRKTCYWFKATLLSLFYPLLLPPSRISYYSSAMEMPCVASSLSTDMHKLKQTSFSVSSHTAVMEGITPVKLDR